MHGCRQPRALKLNEVLKEDSVVTAPWLTRSESENDELPDKFI
jgi:hypothetical protein